MMNDEKNILRNKTFQFAVRIYKLYRYIVEEKKKFILSKQLIRSGTSRGANVREAYNASSKPDFTNKLSIAQKETDETLYWLELMLEVELLHKHEFDSIHADGIEILKMIRSSILTTKKNIELQKPQN